MKEFRDFSVEDLDSENNKKFELSDKYQPFDGATLDDKAESMFVFLNNIIQVEKWEVKERFDLIEKESHREDQVYYDMYIFNAYFMDFFFIFRELHFLEFALEEGIETDWDKAYETLLKFTFSFEPKTDIVDGLIAGNETMMLDGYETPFTLDQPRYSDLSWERMINGGVISEKEEKFNPGWDGKSIIK